MVTVDMSSDLHLKSLTIWGKFSSHFVDFLWSDFHIGLEGLHILVEIYAHFLTVLPFGCHKFLEGGIPTAVLLGLLLA